MQAYSSRECETASQNVIQNLIKLSWKLKKKKRDLSLQDGLSRTANTRFAQTTAINNDDKNLQTRQALAHTHSSLHVTGLCLRFISN
jgi:hypothetical protein